MTFAQQQADKEWSEEFELHKNRYFDEHENDGIEIVQLIADSINYAYRQMNPECDELKYELDEDEDYAE